MSIVLLVLYGWSMGFLVVWRSIFRFWGEANQTPGSSGFPGVYTCIKRGIAESVVMMVGVGVGGCSGG